MQCGRTTLMEAPRPYLTDCISIHATPFLSSILASLESLLHRISSYIVSLDHPFPSLPLPFPLIYYHILYILYSFLGQHPFPFSTNYCTVILPLPSFPLLTSPTPFLPISVPPSYFLHTLTHLLLTTAKRTAVCPPSVCRMPLHTLVASKCLVERASTTTRGWYCSWKHLRASSTVRLMVTSCPRLTHAARHASHTESSRPNTNNTCHNNTVQYFIRVLYIYNTLLGYCKVLKRSKVYL